MESNKIKETQKASLTLNWLFLLSFLIVLFIYIIPWYNDVSNDKQNLLKTIKEYENLEKNWLTFQEFRSSDGAKKEDIRSIIQNIDNAFYNDNFKNTTSNNYISFIESKQTEINDLKVSWILDDREKQISKLLPFYSDWIQIDWAMSDLNFVNYVENMLRTFQLRNRGNIWITQVNLLDKSSDNNIENQIFYIPLTLSLEWRKIDILEFLYFIQNVWSVEWITKDEEIIIYSDDFLSKRSIWSGENIYHNRLVDIASVSFRWYVDTWDNQRSENIKTTQDFINSISSDRTQASEIYSIELSLRFYVKGLPSYRIENFIRTVIQNYNDITKTTTNTLSQVNSSNLQTNEKVILNNKLKSIEIFLTDIKTRVDELQINLNRWQNINTTYRRALDLEIELSKIQDYLSKIKIN